MLHQYHTCEISSNIIFCAGIVNDALLPLGIIFFLQAFLFCLHDIQYFCCHWLCNLWWSAGGGKCSQLSVWELLDPKGKDSQYIWVKALQIQVSSAFWEWSHPSHTNHWHGSLEEEHFKHEQFMLCNPHYCISWNIFPFVLLMHVNICWIANPA